MNGLVDRPLLGEADRRMPSSLVADFTAVFPHTWRGSKPVPRFGDLAWEISGVDPGRTRADWSVSFDSMTPEWALLTREVMFVHINSAEFRERVWIHRNSRLARDGHLRASTIEAYVRSFREVESISSALGLGLPRTWTADDVDSIRDVVLRDGRSGIGRIIRLLYRVAPVLTLGGIRFDPMRGMTAHQWDGGADYSRMLSGQGLRPELFRAVVGNALFYVEQASRDILAARAWRVERDLWRSPMSTPKSSRAAYLDAYPDHPDVVNEVTRRLHDAMEELGGFPSSTVRTAGKSARVGEPCRETLRAAAGFDQAANYRAFRPFIDGRIASGVPMVPGGLPIEVACVRRPDGTFGPWRDNFCWNSIDVESLMLADAAKIVVMAFTAMRDSELDAIPRHGWRTTWHGSPALWSEELKTRAGEPMRWWATPTVLSACDVLDKIIDPEAPFLFQTVRFRRIRDASDRANGENWKSIQRFVSRLGSDPHLHGFLPVDAGWGTLGARPRNDAGPTVTPRAFRYTLASISNFVALGDVAFQQQAKHAHIAMSHSYAANGANSDWTGSMLNTLANSEAQERAMKTVDLYMRIWLDDEVVGHAGRGLVRSARRLFDELDVAPYDDEAAAGPEEQFEARVLSTPELVQAIRSTASILHPGTLVHCLRYVPTMECVEDGTEPIQGLCRPESCANVLVDPEQQPLIRERHRQVQEWLGMPRIGKAQRQVLERRERLLASQLRSEDIRG
ncbi:hypothetical protein [Nocardioides jejuensis]|uniref:Integrase n=1 Tax=Nocardioides jejuensis TaxID=2502782 RepID=A0A4R1BUP0_9ACTN|nr:hypothetical protein [Nocardioides jejuensis]TCJ21644.1 hypothetical protein EPD65_14545 [Nocardioides jejuensis]